MLGVGSIRCHRTSPPASPWTFNDDPPQPIPGSKTNPENMEPWGAVNPEKRIWLVGNSFCTEPTNLVTPEFEQEEAEAIWVQTLVVVNTE